MHPTLIRIDFKNARQQRQKENNAQVLNNLKNSEMNKKKFNECININALKRVLLFTGRSETELLKEASENELVADMLSLYISKESSRQGAKDEILQIDVCNKIATQCDIVIQQLNKNDKYPTKNGEILSKKEIKKKGFFKADGLKSFDAKITGKINGYMSFKVTINNGGHQDNVLNELKALINWWMETKQESFLIILWDTDLKKKLQELKNYAKIQENIKVMNHEQFQEYMIKEFYIESSLDIEDKPMNNQDKTTLSEDSSSECSESDVIVYEGKDDKI